MAEQHTIEVGNAIIVLTGMNAPFSDGQTIGYLECYDEHTSPEPVTASVNIFWPLSMNRPCLPSGKLDASRAGWKPSWRMPRRLLAVLFQRNG